jgi:hypothetical protein
LVWKKAPFIGGRWVHSLPKTASVHRRFGVDADGLRRDLGIVGARTQMHPEPGDLLQMRAVVTDYVDTGHGFLGGTKRRSESDGLSCKPVDMPCMWDLL